MARLRLMSSSIAGAVATFEQLAGPLDGPIRLRRGFAYLTSPEGIGTYSDRRVPPRERRPPATRIGTSRGAALRLELTALALAQTRHRAGKRVTNHLPLRPDNGADLPMGWIDLIASPAVHHSGRTSMTANDKKLRQLNNALDRLEQAGLVGFPPSSGRNVSREGFELLDERGHPGRPAGLPLEYRIPLAREAVFELPKEFVTKGWVHVLEDSEINLLLMAACGDGNIASAGGVIAIPGDIRVRHYGIGRDPFSAAHPMLRRFGLLDVIETNRHLDGRGVDYADDGAHLHRLSLLPDGFQENALEKVAAVLSRSHTG